MRHSHDQEPCRKFAIHDEIRELAKLEDPCAVKILGPAIRVLFDIPQCAINECAKLQSRAEAAPSVPEERVACFLDRQGMDVQQLTHRRKSGASLPSAELVSLFLFRLPESGVQSLFPKRDEALRRYRH